MSHTPRPDPRPPETPAPARPPTDGRRPGTPGWRAEDRGSPAGRVPGRRSLLGASAALAPVLLLSGAGRAAAGEPDRQGDGDGDTEPGGRGGAPGPDGRFRPVLPPPTGPYPVGHAELHLRDRARRDPWRPGAARELMVTLLHPAHEGGEGRPRWLTAEHAADLERDATELFGLRPGAVDWAGIRTNAAEGAPVRRLPGGLPAVLFMPGARIRRAEGILHAEELASRGLLVVLLDHTHETRGVTFPDGRVVRTVDDDVRRSTHDEPELLIGTRIADTAFVLDELRQFHLGRDRDASGRAVPPGLRGALDPARLGIFGHAAGGFAAGEAMHRDARFRAGAGLGGPLHRTRPPADGAPGAEPVRGFGRTGSDGLRKEQAFLLVGAESGGPQDLGRPSPHSHADGGSEGSRQSLRSAHRGWRRDFTLRGSVHGTFTASAPVHQQLVAGAGASPERVARYFGTTDAVRGLAAQRALLGTYFLHRLLGRDHGGLLDGETAAHPDLIHVP
jgi:hypothetical protein